MKADDSLWRKGKQTQTWVFNVAHTLRSSKTNFCALAVNQYVRNVKPSLRSAQNIKLKRDPVYSSSKLGCLFQLSNQSPHTASQLLCVTDRSKERASFLCRALMARALWAFSRLPDSLLDFLFLQASCERSCWEPAEFSPIRWFLVENHHVVLNLLN